MILKQHKLKYKHFMSVCLCRSRCTAQAQRLREQAEALFQKHRERGGHAAQRDQRLPREERDALFELKKEGSRLWDTANDLVKLASEQVLLQSQVRVVAALAYACANTLAIQLATRSRLPVSKCCFAAR